VLLKHPRNAFGDAASIEGQWRQLGYGAAPDLARALEEYEAFAGLFTERGVKVHYLEPDEGTGLDSLYTRDASVVTNAGVILCRMGKVARRGEPAAQERAFGELGIPVLGTIEAPGTLEGGDVAWLDDSTLAVGRGYRTNDAGIEQLCELVDGLVEEVIEVPSPHWRGPEDVFHLMSVLSPLDHDLALVYSPLLPVPFRELLLERGTTLVEVPHEEFDSQGANALALGPRSCLLVEGNPETRKRLEAAGVEVVVFSGEEICVKGSGGPTCLTRPLTRSVPKGR
jgi:N-dimethylarginine dimethylaminohydrolase